MKKKLYENKFNFNIDSIENNEKTNSLSKSSYKSITQKELCETNVLIDLGLPSGTIWCKFNLGCDFNLLNYDYENTIPEDWYGEYYAWGELVKKPDYTFGTYKFVNNRNITKYTDKDNLTLLLLEDDAAYLNLHIGKLKFKIPTKDLFYELLDYTSIEIVKITKILTD